MRIKPGVYEYHPEICEKLDPESCHDTVLLRLRQKIIRWQKINLITDRFKGAAQITETQMDDQLNNKK